MKQIILSLDGALNRNPTQYWILRDFTIGTVSWNHGVLSFISSILTLEIRDSTHDAHSRLWGSHSWDIHPVLEVSQILILVLVEVYEGGMG